MLTNTVIRKGIPLSISKRYVGDLIKSVAKSIGDNLKRPRPLEEGLSKWFPSGKGNKFVGFENAAKVNIYDVR